MAQDLRQFAPFAVVGYLEGGYAMMNTVSPAMPGLMYDMGKKIPDDDKELPKQVNFKPSTRLMERLVAVAKALEVDMANLARMIISENLYIYERRAKEAHRGPGTADDHA